MNNFEIKINESGAFALAKSLCENYHYSGTVPPSKWYFTIYEDGELVGVITYGNGANMNGAKQFGLTQQEAVELTRVCFKKHKNFLTMYLSKAHKHLKQNGVKLVYSYSDLRQSHFGTLYKAANFKFGGEKKLSGIEIFNKEKNRWEHQRNYWKAYKKQDLKWNDWVKAMQFETRKQSNKFLWVLKFNV